MSLISWWPVRGFVLAVTVLVGLLLLRYARRYLSIVLTMVVFAAFGVYVMGGGAFEMRTVGAMTLRSLVWAGIAIFAWRTIGPSGGGKAHGRTPALG